MKKNNRIKHIFILLSFVCTAILTMLVSFHSTGNDTYAMTVDSIASGYTELSEGYTTENHYYKISTAASFAQLSQITASEEDRFVLTTDIDLDGTTLSPITSFAGVLDGNGHIVSNMSLPKTSNGNYTFISSLSGVIQDITFDSIHATKDSSNATEQTDWKWGTVSLVHTTKFSGLLENVSIIDSKFYDDSSYASWFSASALVIYNNGILRNSEISNSKFYSSGHSAGFAVKNYENGIIETCSLTNTTILGLIYVGGIAAYNDGMISGCISFGSHVFASNPNDMGNVSLFSFTSEPLEENYFNIGYIDARSEDSTTYVGGLVAFNVGDLYSSVIIEDYTEKTNISTSSYYAAVNATFGSWYGGILTGTNEGKVMLCLADAIFFATTRELDEDDWFSTDAANDGRHYFGLNNGGQISYNFMVSNSYYLDNEDQGSCSDEIQEATLDASQKDYYIDTDPYNSKLMAYRDRIETPSYPQFTFDVEDGGSIVFNGVSIESSSHQISFSFDLPSGNTDQYNALYDHQSRLFAISNQANVFSPIEYLGVNLSVEETSGKAYLSRFKQESNDCFLWFYDVTTSKWAPYNKYYNRTSSDYDNSQITINMNLKFYYVTFEFYLNTLSNPIDATTMANYVYWEDPENGPHKEFESGLYNEGGIGGMLNALDSSYDILIYQSHKNDEGKDEYESSGSIGEVSILQSCTIRILAKERGYHNDTDYYSITYTLPDEMDITFSNGEKTLVVYTEKGTSFYLSDYQIGQSIKLLAGASEAYYKVTGISGIGTWNDEEHTEATALSSDTFYLRSVGSDITFTLTVSANSSTITYTLSDDTLYFDDESNTEMNEISAKDSPSFKSIGEPIQLYDGESYNWYMITSFEITDGDNSYTFTGSSDPEITVFTNDTVSIVLTVTKLAYCIKEPVITVNKNSETSKYERLIEFYTIKYSKSKSTIEDLDAETKALLKDNGEYYYSTDESVKSVYVWITYSYNGFDKQVYLGTYGALSETIDLYTVTLEASLPYGISGTVVDSNSNASVGGKEFALSNSFVYKFSCPGKKISSVTILDDTGSELSSSKYQVFRDYILVSDVESHISLSNITFTDQDIKYYIYYFDSEEDLTNATKNPYNVNPKSTSEYSAGATIEFYKDGLESGKIAKYSYYKDGRKILFTDKTMPEEDLYLLFEQVNPYQITFKYSFVTKDNEVGSSPDFVLSTSSETLEQIVRTSGGVVDSNYSITRYTQDSVDTNGSIEFTIGNIYDALYLWVKYPGASSFEYIAEIDTDWVYGSSTPTTPNFVYYQVIMNDVEIDGSDDKATYTGTKEWFIHVTQGGFFDFVNTEYTIEYNVPKGYIITVSDDSCEMISDNEFRFNPSAGKTITPEATKKQYTITYTIVDIDGNYHEFGDDSLTVAKAVADANVYYGDTIPETYKVGDDIYVVDVYTDSDLLLGNEALTICKISYYDSEGNLYKGTTMPSNNLVCRILYFKALLTYQSIKLTIKEANGNTTMPDFTQDTLFISSSNEEYIPSDVFAFIVSSGQKLSFGYYMFEEDYRSGNSSSFVEYWWYKCPNGQMICLGQMDQNNSNTTNAILCEYQVVMEKEITNVEFTIGDTAIEAKVEEDEDTNTYTVYQVNNEEISITFELPEHKVVKEFPNWSGSDTTYTISATNGSSSTVTLDFETLTVTYSYTVTFLDGTEDNISVNTSQKYNDLFADFLFAAGDVKHESSRYLLVTEVLEPSELFLEEDTTITVYAKECNKASFNATWYQTDADTSAPCILAKENCKVYDASCEGFYSDSKLLTVSDDYVIVDGILYVVSNDAPYVVMQRAYNGNIVNLDFSQVTFGEDDNVRAFYKKTISIGNPNGYDDYDITNDEVMFVSSTENGAYIPFSFTTAKYTLEPETPSCYEIASDDEGNQYIHVIAVMPTISTETFNVAIREYTVTFTISYEKDGETIEYPHIVSYPYGTELNNSNWYFQGDFFTYTPIGLDAVARNLIITSSTCQHQTVTVQGNLSYDLEAVLAEYELSVTYKINGSESSLATSSFYMYSDDGYESKNDDYVFAYDSDTKAIYAVESFDSIYCKILVGKTYFEFGELKDYESSGMLVDAYSVTFIMTNQLTGLTNASTNEAVGASHTVHMLNSDTPTLRFKYKIGDEQYTLKCTDSGYESSVIYDDDTKIHTFEITGFGTLTGSRMINVHVVKRTHTISYDIYVNESFKESYTTTFDYNTLVSDAVLKNNTILRNESVSVAYVIQSIDLTEGTEKTNLVANLTYRITASQASEYVIPIYGYDGLSTENVKLYDAEEYDNESEAIYSVVKISDAYYICSNLDSVYMKVTLATSEFELGGLSSLRSITVHSVTINLTNEYEEYDAIEIENVYYFESSENVTITSTLKAGFNITSNTSGFNITSNVITYESITDNLTLELTVSATEYTYTIAFEDSLGNTYYLDSAKTKQTYSKTYTILDTVDLSVYDYSKHLTLYNEAGSIDVLITEFDKSKLVEGKMCAENLTITATVQQCYYASFQQISVGDATELTLDSIQVSNSPLEIEGDLIFDLEYGKIVYFLEDCYLWVKIEDNFYYARELKTSISSSGYGGLSMNYISISNATDLKDYGITVPSKTYIYKDLYFTRTDDGISISSKTGYTVDDENCKITFSSYTGPFAFIVKNRSFNIIYNFEYNVTETENTDSVSVGYQTKVNSFKYVVDSIVYLYPEGGSEKCSYYITNVDATDFTLGDTMPSQDVYVNIIVVLVYESDITITADGESLDSYTLSCSTSNSRYEEVTFNYLIKNHKIYHEEDFYLWATIGSQTLYVGQAAMDSDAKSYALYTVSNETELTGVTITGLGYYLPNQEVTLHYEFDDSEAVSGMVDNSSNSVEIDEDLKTIKLTLEEGAISLKLEVKTKLFYITYEFTDKYNEEGETTVVQQVRYTETIEWEYKKNDVTELYPSAGASLQEQYLITRIYYDVTITDNKMPATNFTVTVSAVSVYDSTIEVNADGSEALDFYYSSTDTEFTETTSATYYKDGTLYYQKDASIYLFVKLEDKLYFAQDLTNHEDSYSLDFYSIKLSDASELSDQITISGLGYYLSTETDIVLSIISDDPGATVSIESDTLTVNTSNNTITIPSISEALEITLKEDFKYFTVTYTFEQYVSYTDETTNSKTKEVSIQYTKDINALYAEMDLLDLFDTTGVSGKYIVRSISCDTELSNNKMPAKNITFTVSADKAYSAAIALSADTKVEDVSTLDFKVSGSATEIVANNALFVIEGTSIYYTAATKLWITYNEKDIYLGELTTTTVDYSFTLYSISLKNDVAGTTISGLGYYLSDTEDIVLGITAANGYTVSIKDSLGIVDEENNTITIEKITGKLELELTSTPKTYVISYTFTPFVDEDATSHVITASKQYTTNMDIPYEMNQVLSLYASSNTAKDYIITGISVPEGVTSTMPAKDITITINTILAKKVSLSIQMDDEAKAYNSLELSFSSRSDSIVASDLYHAYVNNYLYYSEAFSLFVTLEDKDIYLGTLSMDDTNEYSFDIYSISVNGTNVSLESGNGYYLKGTTNIVLTFMIADGYKVTSDYDDAEYTDNTITVPQINAPLVIEAGRTEKTYQVYYYRNEEDYNSYYNTDKNNMSSGTHFYKDASDVLYLDAITLELNTIDRENSIKIAGWVNALTGEAIPDGSSMPAGDLVLYATWIEVGHLEYTLNLSDNGKLVQDEATLRLSTSSKEFIEITKDNDSDYIYEYKNGTYSWKYSEDTLPYLWIKYPGASEYVFFKESSDAKATPTLTLYNVLVNNLEHGVINGIGYQPAGKLVLSFKMDDGYDVICENSGLTIYNNTLTIFDFDGTVTYNFSSYLIEYYIYYRVFGHEWKEQMYHFGDTIDLLSYDAGDYSFEYWMKNGEEFIDTQMPAGSFFLDAKLSDKKINTVGVILPDDSLIEASMIFISSSETEVVDLKNATITAEGLKFEYTGDGYLWIHDPYTGTDKYLGITASGNPEIEFVTILPSDESLITNLTVSNLGAVLKGYTQTIEIEAATGYGCLYNGEILESNTLIFTAVSESITLNITEYQIEYYLYYIVSDEIVHTDAYHYDDEITLWTYEGDFEFAAWSINIHADPFNGHMQDYSVNVYAQKKVSLILTEEPSVSKLHENQLLSEAEFTGGEVYLGSTLVSGTFSFLHGNTKVLMSDSMKTEFEAIFTPDNVEYIPLSFTITVEVCKPKFQVEDLAEPTLVKATDTTLVFKMNENYEYSLDKKIYRAGGVITLQNLKRGSNVTIYYRYREDSDYCMSELASKVFRTLTKDEMLYNTSSQEGISTITSYATILDNSAIQKMMTEFKDMLERNYENSLMSGEETEEFVEYLKDVLASVFEIEETRSGLAHLGENRIQGYADEKIKEIVDLVSNNVSKEEISSYKNYVIDVLDATDHLVNIYDVLSSDLNGKKVYTSSTNKTSIMLTSDAIEDASLSQSKYVVEKVDELLGYDYSDYKNIDVADFETEFVGKTVTLMSDAKSGIRHPDSENGKKVSMIIGDKISKVQSQTYMDYKFDRAHYDELFYLAAEAAIIANLQGIVLTELDNNYQIKDSEIKDAAKKLLLYNIYLSLVEKYSDYESFRQYYYDTIGDSGEMTYQDVVKTFSANLEDELVIPITSGLSDIEIILLISFITVIAALIVVIIVKYSKKRRVAYAESRR